MLRPSRWGLRRAPDPPSSASGAGSTAERDVPAALRRATRRCAVALLLGLGALALVPLPAAAQEDVPLTWSLIPDGLGNRGDTFRLMFVSRNKRDGGSDYISNYNNTVRTAAGNGHPDLDEFRNQFDAVASTRDRDARDNTDTNPNSDGAGEPIYWVRGAKVADHYADFYNGSLGQHCPGVRGRGAGSRGRTHHLDGVAEQRDREIP